MRRIFTTLTLLFAITATMAEQPTTLYDEGVSRELAKHRKANISDLRYDLSFDLLADEGMVTITLNSKCDGELIIDYRELDNILSVNGLKDGYKLLNEHIIVPCTEGENSVTIRFDIDYQSLNDSGDFVYTLLVPDRARTLFPCFDQPDLKASYTLTLGIPHNWVAVSNTDVDTEYTVGDCHVIRFKPTEPLSTYLFSFVAGELYHRTYDDGKHRFTAYYRETDPQRLAQLDTIFAQVAASLEWLEEYTGIEYPFAKYDFVILPGFQYGGMEHTGATLYNDTQMFLGENPSLDEELRRTQLIAHETAHMWFGDYVTMAWFDDVWTKEVFANYFAARMTEPLYPEVNHALNRLKTYTSTAYNEDRTTGSTPIRQELDNLNNAGLIYGQIIYNKAPIVMEKIVEVMGEEAFRAAIQEYLRTYAYGNATWDDLVAILDRHTVADIASMSYHWIGKAHMGTIYLYKYKGRWLLSNPDGKARLQSFNCALVYEDGTMEQVTIPAGTVEYIAPRDVKVLLPNSDGRGYGYFMLPKEVVAWLTENMSTIEDDLMRQSLIMTLNEVYEQSWMLSSSLDSRRWLDFILSYLPKEDNYLIASTLDNYLTRPLLRVGTAEDEERLWEIATTHDDSSLRRNLKMTLAHTMRSETIIVKYYFDIWRNEGDKELNEREYMTLAYELAVRYPMYYDEIYETQLARITNPDRCDQFKFIMRAIHPDGRVRNELFAMFMEPSKRRPEPWTSAALGYLNHHLRQGTAVKYIYPALDELREVQRTGDIFFPRSWVGMLLDGHSSKEAFAEVCRWMDDNRDYPRLLMNKVEQAAWGLLTSFKHKSVNTNRLRPSESLFFNMKHIKKRGKRRNQQ